MNLAAVWQVPVIFVVQNNGYAISTPTERQYRATSLADRGVAYGIPAVRVDGNDVLAVVEVMDEAIRVGATGGGPVLVEALTYRMGPHTNVDDPSLYRPAGEEAVWSDSDPVRRLEDHLATLSSVDTGAILRLRTEISDEVRAFRGSVTADLAGPAFESLTSHVYA